MMRTYFISDLHLASERPDTLQAFLDFMSGPARQAEELFILGDLFEAWVGDDDDSELARSIIDALAKFSSSGTPLYFMQGNRDFLVGKRFAEQTGCKLLPDYHVFDLYGRKTLLMHGDLLCTDDVTYLLMRHQFHNRSWQQEFLSLPLDERWYMAKQLRAHSKASMISKDEDIMDANAEAVLTTMKQYDVDDLIHGHTHRPAVHEIDLDGRQRRRIVLGDWYDQDSVLLCEGDRRELVRINQL